MIPKGIKLSKVHKTKRYFVVDNKSADFKYLFIYYRVNPEFIL